MCHLDRSVTSFVTRSGERGPRRAALARWGAETPAFALAVAVALAFAVACSSPRILPPQYKYPILPRMDEFAYVYILASSFKHLYIGVTSELMVRIASHKNGRYPNSFTARYKIDRLVYFERFGDIHAAIAREKQLKRWSRIKKIRLIVASNPDWNDLSEPWGKPVEPFREPA
jgi:putative endonuclease